MKNLFAGLSMDLPEEISEVLAQNRHLRIERIVSAGHSSPEEFWYDQQQTEWIVVLKGEARLRFEDDAQPLCMLPGDHIMIPAHKKHRVEWTTPDEPTVWLALFFDEQ